MRKRTQRAVCGIAGYTGSRIDALNARMFAAIAPRGPDASDSIDRGEVQLLHTRLSIVDLSATGAQPMLRLSDRLAVSFNGEIYNYEELRAAIERRGLRFEGHSDTELVPLGFAAFGLDIVRRLNGMFAFALHDAADGSLYLARDAFGIKPLYYADLPAGGLVFSSSARAVALHPEVSRDLDPAAIRDFLQNRYVPSGRCFFRAVKTLAPGTILHWRGGRASTQRFWAPRHRCARDDVAPDALVEELRNLLDDSVNLQLRSDVPVGVFLSGGIDSEAIMHFAVRHSKEPPLAFTFSIGDAHDESKVARAIASRYGARHEVVSIGANNPLERLYEAVTCMDVPVGDAIIVPTYLLCEAAASKRKVVLTGEGADELFGGYVHVPVLRQLARVAPAAMILHHIAPLVGRLPPRLLNPFFDYQADLGTQGRNRVARLLAATGDGAAALRIATTIFSDEEIRSGTSLSTAPLDGGDLSLSGLLKHGFETWLPNQILNKMDQLSMAHGLEARVPYLDLRIYDLLSRVPERMLLHGKRNKVLLRELAAVEGIGNTERRKHAFHLPVERQYRTELLQLAEAWLSDGALRKHGIVRPSLVSTTLGYLRRGDFIASKQVVAMICLHMWLDANACS